MYRHAQAEHIKDITAGVVDHFAESFNARLSTLENNLKEYETEAARMHGHGGGAGAPMGHNAPEFKALGQWVRTGVVDANVRAQLSTDHGPDGGFWLAPAIHSQIEKKERDISPMLRIAHVIPVKTGMLEFVTEDSHAETEWTGERQEPADTDSPEIGTITIPVHEGSAAPRATQKILEDMPHVDTWLVNAIAEAKAAQNGQAFVAGNGTTRPRGFTTYDKSSAGDGSRAKLTHQYVATGASGAFASVDPADVFFDIERHTKPVFRRDAVWVMNSATHAMCKKIKDGEGRYLLTTDFTNGVVDRILGKEVVIMEDMPDVAADSFAIAYGSFRRGYTVLDRLGTTVMRDPFTQKPFVVFWARHRVGGGCVNFDAIKFIKFGAS